MKDYKLHFITLALAGLFSMSVLADPSTCSTAQADENAVAQYAAGGVANDIPYASNVVDFSNGITFEEMSCNNLSSCYSNLVTQSQGMSNANFKVMLDSSAAANVIRNIVQGSTTTAVSFAAPTAPTAATRTPHGGREYGRLLINAPSQTTSFKFSTVALGSQVKLFLRRAYVAYSIYNGAASDNRNSAITVSYKITRGSVVQTGTIPSFCNGASVTPFTPASTPPANLATALSKNVLAVSTCPYEQLSINIPQITNSTGSDNIVIVELTLSSSANFKYAPTSTETLINPQVTFAIDDITTDPRPTLPEPRDKCHAPYQLDQSAAIKCDKEASAPGAFQYVIHYSSKNRVQSSSWEYQDIGVFWNTDFAYSPPKPGLYDVYSICKAPALTGSSPSSVTIVCGKSMTKSDYIIRSTSLKSPIAARIAQDTAIIFAQIDPCLASNVSTYNVWRKNSSSTAPFKVNSQPISVDAMKSDGLIDSGLSPHLDYQYALEPLDVSNQPVGGKTAWDQTTWKPGEFDVYTDGGIVINPTDHTDVLYLEMLAHYKTAQGINDPIRVLSAQPSHIGFRIDPINFVPMTTINVTDISLGLDHSALSKHNIEGFYIEDRGVDNTPRPKEFSYQDLNQTTQIIWLVAGDLTKQELTYPQVLKALKFFEGSGGMEAGLYQKVQNRDPNPLLPAIDLTYCTSGNPYFHCKSQTQEKFPVLALSIPTIPTLITYNLTRFYLPFMNEDNLTNAWFPWVNKHFQELYPNFTQGVDYSRRSTVNELGENHNIARAGLSLLKMDETNLIIFDRQPGNNLFKPGAAITPQWGEAFGQIMSPKFAPSWMNVFSATQAIALLQKHLELFNGFSNAFHKLYSLPFNAQDFKMSDYKRAMSETFFQIQQCNENGVHMWPGEENTQCHWADDMDKPLSCTPDLQCNTQGYGYYNKKWTGYDENTLTRSTHATGYLEGLRGYVARNVPRNFPQRAALQKIMGKLEQFYAENKLLFSTQIDTGGFITRDAPHIEINSCQCVFQDKSKWPLKVLIHEGVHAVHIERVYEAFREKMPQLDDTLSARWSLWTEYKAYRFVACLFGEEDCSLTKERFIQKTFFENPVKMKLYVKDWQGQGACTVGHQGLEKIKCENITDLDWLPFDNNGNDYCDPFYMRQAPCPADLP